MTISDSPRKPTGRGVALHRLLNCLSSARSRHVGVALFGVSSSRLHKHVSPGIGLSAYKSKPQMCLGLRHHWEAVAVGEVAVFLRGIPEVSKPVQMHNRRSSDVET